MGFALGLGAGILFGLSGVFIKMGMRRAGVDNGHFMSVSVNWMLIFVVALFVTLPRWDWTGVLFFILAGTVTSFLGRGTSLAAIRLIGPSRQSTILISAPVFAAVLGWMILGEGVTIQQALGAVIVTIGLIVLMRSRMDEEGGPRPDVTVEQVGSEVPLIARTRQVLQADRFVRGVVIAFVSALFFGTGFVFRKAGLAHMPSAVMGALFGATTGLTLIIIRATARGRLKRLVSDNFKPIPWLFALSGLVSGTAQLLQFMAFDYLQAWIVSLLQGTQGVWTLLWAYVFLRREESIGKAVVGSVLLVMAGVAVMTID